MNKTVSANISGFIFNIEEEAYQKLREYLKRIKESFTSSEGGDEIMQDIESRIAELFEERLNSNKQVITISDVDDVINIMGKPEDYQTDFGEEEAAHQTSQKSERNSRRRIFRDPDDAVIGGVCSGFSHYLNWDPIILRLIFVFSVIMAGTGIILYIILWAVIPEAKNTTEKLQMRGSKVNVENISKKINEEMDNLKKNVDKLASDTGEQARKVTQSTNSGLNKFFDGLGNFMEAIGNILVKIIGLAFLLAGIGMFIGLVVAWFVADSTIFSYGQLDWSMIDDLVFMGNGNLTMLAIGATLVVGSIIGMLVLTGIKILLDIKSSVKAVTLTLVGFLIVGIILASFAGSKTAREYTHDGDYTENLDLDTLVGDTLYVQVMPDLIFNDRIHNRSAEFLELTAVKDGKVILGEPVKLKFYRQDSDGEYRMQVRRESNGPFHTSALQNAENIEYAWELKGDTLLLPPNLAFPYDDGFHGQRAEIVIYIPEGRYVKLSKNAGRIYWRPRYEGKLLKMGSDDWEIQKP